jgi:hypothetical protein
MRTNFWCTRVQIFGHSGKDRCKKKERGIQKRERGIAFFLKKETHGVFGIPSQIEYPNEMQTEVFFEQRTEHC